MLPLRVPITVLLLAVAARADDPPRPSGAPVPSDPVFRALKIDGATASGRIRELGPGGSVVLVGEKGEQSIALGDLVKLDRDGESPTWPPEGALAVFPEGDRLRGVIGTSAETAIEIRPNALGDALIRIPVDRLLGVILNAPVDLSAQESLIERVRVEPRKSDVLWLANGDRLAGDLLSLGADRVKFQVDATPIDVDRAGSVAMGMNPAAVDYPKPAGDWLECTTLDGSRLGVSRARVDQGQLVAMTRFGVEIRLPLAELSRVHVRSSRVAYLSDRQPAADQYTPYVGPTRPYRRDRAVDGREIRLGGRPFDRGIGMQSRTFLAYRLEPGDRRFQATIGLDDRAGPLGSVVFRVLVDRKQERFASPPMASRDAPRSIDVDVSGAQYLILEVDFGDRGEVRDFADWAEARLIR